MKNNIESMPISDDFADSLSDIVRGDEDSVSKKFTTKRIDTGRKIIDVAQRKEWRAIRLFEYIEKCERQEKEEKLAKLSAHVAIQRKVLDEQTLRLNTKMQNMKMEAQKKKVDALAEKRQFLLQIGRAKGDKSHGQVQEKLVESEELHVFKSRFYDQQAQEMKSIRSKIKEQQDQFRTKRAELFQKFSVKKNVQEEYVQNESSRHQNNEPDIQDELDRIIKKYSRPDSPVNDHGRNQEKLSSTEILLRAKIDTTKRMQDNLKKNKARTKQLTDGAENHFGIVSSIALNFQESTRHARTLNDPAWDLNKPEPFIDVVSAREPIEYILKSKKGPPTSFVSPAKPLLGSKKSQAFVGLDVVDSEENNLAITTIEEDEVNAREKNLKTNKSLTPEERKIIERTSSMINGSTRFVQFRHKSISLVAKTPPSDADTARINSTLIHDPEGNHDFVDLDLDADLDEIPDDLLPVTPKNFSKRVSRKSIIDRKGFVQSDPTRSYASTHQSIIPEDSVNSLQPIGVETDNRHSAYRPVTSVKLENPFSGNYQLLRPDSIVEAPLNEWLQQIHSKDPGKKVNRPEKWPAISLDAVAEFGKTIYPQKALSTLANAAENEAEIAKTKRSCPRYQKKMNLLDEYFTERFEKSKNAMQMPVIGVKFWVPELKYSKDLEEEGEEV